MNKTILVVDDSPIIVEKVSYVLTNEGFDVINASNGEEAISFFDGRTIDLVIADYNMPKMNGIELIKNIRKTEGYKHTPVLMLTTELQNDKKTVAKNAGATGWITKPFVPEKLLAAVNKVIR